MTSIKTSSKVDTVLAALTLTACVALIGYKALLTTRININWDEFWYLSFVHALERGELTLLLQGAYTHAFRWLTGIAGSEIEQIVAGRLVMLALLGVTAWLIWSLGRRWFTGFAAALPPLVYLSLIPVAHHGGSFRADSLLAPLLMGALVLLARRPHDARHEMFAGALLGLAAVVTVKVLLFAPMMACFIVALSGRAPQGVARPAAILRSAVRVGIAAGLVAVVLLVAHATSLAPTAGASPGTLPAESISTFASRTAVATILNSPLFARFNVTRQYAHWQPLPWLLFTLGFMAALYKRKFDLAVFALAALPIAIYRNSFPYFYLVMMAPVSVLAGYAVHSISGYVGGRSPRLSGVLLSSLLLGVMSQSYLYIGRLWQDDQLVQRRVVEGVHEIFPDLVNYVDRCGMIASYRKVNFFVSTWGLEAYRARGEPFMPAALAESEPAFVIANAAALFTYRPSANGLLEIDRQLMERFYPRYWGPVRVAGAVARLDVGQPQNVEVPFSAKYRLEAAGPLFVNGVQRQPGDIIFIAHWARAEIVQNEAGSAAPMVIKLFLAAARPRPFFEPAPEPLFTGL